MLEIADFDFQLVDSKKLSQLQLEQLARLTKVSVALDFPNRADDARQILVDQSTAYRQNLNRLPGTSSFGGRKKRQLFSRHLHALAYSRRNNELVAALPTADNVSTNRGWPLGQLEMAAKDYWDGYIKNRYYWAGLCLLNAEARESLQAASDSEVAVTDVLLTLGTAGRDHRQPATSYPYEAETDWKQALKRLGYDWETDLRPIQAFGDESATVDLSKWQATSVDDIRLAAYEKVGIELPLKNAGYRLIDYRTSLT